MGKRKRTSDHKKPPAVSCLHSDIMPCSFGMDLPSQEKPSCVVSSVSAAVNPLPSVMDTTDSSVKQPNTHPSHRHYHYNLSRATFIRRSLHNHGNQFSQQNSGIHTDTLSSLCKNASPLRDEKLSFKLASQCSSESGHHAERKPFHRSERIRSSPFAMDSISPDVAKMACGICLKLLRRKACNLGNSLSSSGLSVVAVLVCGHVYHADCLEQRTSEGDRCDPPCPLCVDLSLKIGASGGQD